MNTPLHFLLLCQLCRSLRNVSYGGRVLGLIKSAYHGWLSMMTSSEGPPFLVLPRPPPTLNPPLFTTIQKLFSNLSNLKKVTFDCRKKFKISKTNTGARRKTRGAGIKVTKNSRKKNEMLPVTFVGSPYKMHSGLCSKIADVHGIEVPDVRT